MAEWTEHWASPLESQVQVLVLPPSSCVCSEDVPLWTSFFKMKGLNLEMSEVPSMAHTWGSQSLRILSHSHHLPLLLLSHFSHEVTGLPHPWDSPGKNTGVGCHFLLQCRKVKSESEVAQSCLTFQTPWTAAHQAPPSMGVSSSHEIKRHLLLGRKVMANLDSIFKGRDITLPTKSG